MEHEDHLERLDSLYDALDAAIRAEDHDEISRLVEARANVVTALGRVYGTLNPIPAQVRAELSERESALQQSLQALVERTGERLRGKMRRGKAALTYGKRGGRRSLRLVSERRQSGKRANR